MTSNNEESKIVKYRKNRNINIGIVMFGIIFVYLVATIIMYIIAPKISVYEVRQGSILKDTAYTGLAIRDETVVYADESGYINYYAEENSKVKVGTNVYTLSDNKLEFENTVANEDVELSKEETLALLLKIQSYNDQFNELDYASTYNVKEELNHSLNKISNQSKTDQLNQLITNNTSNSLTVKTSAIDGVIVYSVDGMEDLSIDTVKADQLKKSNYKHTEFENNNKINAGDPVYKIVTDDKWKLLVAVSDETKDALADKKSVVVNFKKDNQEIQANLTFLENTEKPIACLSFQNSMIRYINERYLDIELIIEDESGLKIPKSAETKKEFYIVPSSFLSKGGNSSSDSVLVYNTGENGQPDNRLVHVNVYYKEDEMVYLDPNVFDEGTVLAKEDSLETYPLKETKALKGVYCINKGYAIFKQIRILCESDEYYIIEKGNNFGLSNYDHIVLDGQSVNENDVVF